MSEQQQYAGRFSAGMKVGVGIPMPNAEVFRDWAEIHEIDEDLVSLQLSRDQLPVGVSLEVGQILELRGGKEGSGYSCRAIIVSEGGSQEILLRLIGEIVSDELREFYRIDAFLPIKYYIPHEQYPEILKKEWEARRMQRQLEQLSRHRRRWDSSFVAEDAELPHERHEEAAANAPDDEEDGDIWDTIIPLAANISGGGIRITTHQGFERDDYVLLEILIPSPRRIVDAVARVAFANRNYPDGSERESCIVAMQFVYIDERDRDAIVRHIADIQLERIRQLREKYIHMPDHDVESGQAVPSAGPDWAVIGRRIVQYVILAVIVSLLFMFFRDYAHERPKGEIEETFEGGIRRYLEKFK